MAWWTKVEREDGKVEIKKHDGRKPKLSAGIELRFAQSMGNVPLEKMGLYKRDPEKYPDEPNLLPEMQRKAETKDLMEQIRGILKKPRRKG